jgi:dinuclear metal center YbgI/SA1388 family protein
MPILESIVAFCDDLLTPQEIPDYGGAVNGLQVAAPPGREVAKVVAAVDASEAVLHAAVDDEGADLVLVHHGLFWSGAAPVAGPLHRKLRLLLQTDTALYASHLPLDGHPEVGNGVLLARALGLRDLEPFGTYDGYAVGRQGSAGNLAPEELAHRLEEALGGAPVRHIEGGPATVRRVAVVTGAGGSFIPSAAAAGVDALVTGEGAHHTFAQAHELGIHVFYGGHYATETFGVKAVAARLADRFGVATAFVDHPSGL